MTHQILRLLVLTVTLFIAVPNALTQRPRPARVTPAGGIPANVFVQIIRAEDERRWDDSLKRLLAHEDPKVRKRAVLAAGRIGNEAAVPVLAEMLLTDRDLDVRRMTAFALGETESRGGAYALAQVLKKLANEDGVVRARSVEALGKIVAATIAPNAGEKPDEEWLDTVRAEIVGTLRVEDSRRPNPDQLTILLALTAVLRARPDGVGKLVAHFLAYADSRIVADALNTLARLRLKDGNDKARELLVKHNDPIVRANAARVLGAAEDKSAFDALIDRALKDYDLRVRVSAIRALGSLKDERAVQPLLERGEYLLKLTKVSRQHAIEPRNELLEIATALGQINQRTGTPQLKLVSWLSTTSKALDHRAPEVEIAHARVSPENFIVLCGTDKKAVQMVLTDWKAASSIAQGLGETAALLTTSPENVWRQRAEGISRDMLNYRKSGVTIKTPVAVHSEYAIPNILRAFAKFKTDDLAEIARKHLSESDVNVRATAAELLGQQTPSEANTAALIDALPRALRDTDNDAALAILEALAKQKYKIANDAIKTALASKDQLIRRRAVSLLKASGLGDFSDRIGTVQTRNSEADYRRALARIGKKPTATVVTSKGPFTIEFLPEEAPLNVDNFIQLAKKGYFNGQTVPRVVPNFVVQAGDPRGDGSGGPGYAIRCELNQVPYERAAVGMALSGKDTGGSQWFVTHSPQPHLDGGYTVFGRVVRGMEVIDRVARSDRILRVVVSER